jgi:hypothetical protein
VSLSVRNPLRRLETGVGKTLAVIGGFLLATLLVSMVVGVANSNLFWGEANQLARIDIPGAQKVHLPSGTTEATVAVALPGRGTQTPELLLPELQLSVTPYGEGGEAEITEDLGSSVNANDKYDDTSRVVWKIKTPSSGDYRVSIKGDMTGYGVNAQLWLGHQPAWIHGTDIWFVSMALVLAAALVFYLVYFVEKRHKKRVEAEVVQGWHEDGMPSSGEGHFGESVDTAAKRMAKLQRKHEAGGMSDEEFATKRDELEKEFMAEKGLG